MTSNPGTESLPHSEDAERSVLGAVLLNFALAVNHKPGRYLGV